LACGSAERRWQGFIQVAPMTLFGLHGDLCGLAGLQVARIGVQAANIGLRRLIVIGSGVALLPQWRSRAAGERYAKD
jgi:hypothetical protein